MGRGEMQAVELVPGDAPGPVPVAPGTDERPRLSARTRRTLVGLALALCAALAVTQLVLDSRERARLARLASVPRVLAPLGDELDVRWTSDGVAGHLVRTGVRVGDLLVGTSVGADERASVQAVDAASGEIVWSTALGRSVTTPERSSLAPDCHADEDEPGGVVVCLVSGVSEGPGASGGTGGTSDTGGTGGTGPSDDSDGTPSAQVPTWAEVVVLDPATGEVLTRRGTEPSTRVAVVGDALVRARADEGGRLLVTSEDPRTGRERWRFAAEQPLVVDRSFGVLLSLWVTGGHLQLAETQGRTWLLSPEGRLVHSTTTGSEVLEWPEALRGGRIGLVSYEGSGSTRLLLPDGSPGPLLPGVPSFLPVDDGSAPGVLFTADERFHAWDARTGARVWTSEPVGDGAVPWTGTVLLDGALYGADASGRVVALDATTGTTRWTATSVPSTDRSLFTDGRMLLLLEPTARGRQLTGFALADGSRVWGVPLPDVELLSARGPFLFGIPDFGSDRVLALG